MIECCKDGVCYIVTENDWAKHYQPKGFVDVSQVAKDQPDEVAPETVDAVAPIATVKPRGRRK
jgi:hypothetical protein